VVFVRSVFYEIRMSLSQDYWALSYMVDYTYRWIIVATLRGEGNELLMK
jgi:hypothetical protein